MVFGVLACAIVVSDQLLKLWVVANYHLEQPSPILGDWLRIDFIHNSGGLFGMLQGAGQLLALVTIGVVAVLVAMEINSGWRSWLVTLALALLLGGAVGNFIDRARLGYVVDFVDMGIGSLRFYIFNIADSAVTVAILVMLALGFLGPALGRHPGTEREDDRPLDGVGSDSGSGPAVE
ncbi:MAG: signal peptidase II [Candidatus Limnocylindrales bacterium]